jgi:hypothetical protein
MIATSDEVSRPRGKFAQASFEGARTRFEHFRRWSVFSVKHLHDIVVKASGGSGAATLELQGLIACDRASPGRKVGPEGISLCLAGHGQEDFLDDILGVAEVWFDRQDVIQDDLLVLDEKSLHLQGMVGGGVGVSHTQETARGGGLISIRKAGGRATA